MSYITPSVGDGDAVTVSSTTAATITDYQCVTSHGHETVSDASSPTKIEFTLGKATLSPAGFLTGQADTQKGLVHIPIHNPVEMTQTANLKNIIVKFDNFNDANVDTVYLYYSNDRVHKESLSPKKINTFHIDFDTDEALTRAYTYTPPRGVSVALNLEFPHSDSKIFLYSVTLVYQAK